MRWFFLIFLACSGWGVTSTAHAHTPSWARLHAAVQRWRVGEIAGLADELGAIHKSTSDKDIRAVSGFVRARVLARQGQGGAAQEALAGASAIEAVLPTAWIWAQVEVKLAQRKPEEAIARLTELRAADKEFRWSAADLLFSRLTEQVHPGDMAAAVAQQLYAKSPLHLPKDELLARAARNLALLHPQEARGLWVKLLLKHPESTYVEEAERAVPDQQWTDAELFERMERLFARRAYERCRATGLVLWAKEHRRSEVGYYLGKIGSERLRDDYPGAVKYLEVAAAEGEPMAQQALPSYALALSKVGRVEDSLAAYDSWFVRYPAQSNERRVDIAYDRARVLHLHGRSLEAASYLSTMLDVDRKGIDFPKYLWFVGFWQLRGGACDLAIQTLSPLTSDKNPLVGGKARYWMGKCLDALGKRAEGADMLVSVLERHPLTWYSALAEDLLTSWGHKDRVPAHGDFSRVPRQSGDPFHGLKGSPDVRRLRLAVYLGEPDTARAVLDDVRKKLVKSVGKARVEELEAELADPLESYADRRQQAMQDWGDDLKQLPTRETVAHWRAIYPRAYATHVVAAAKRSGAPEWMIYAHMLQESRYKPWLISGAPAYGLLELLDRTAARLAQEAKDDYQLWMLMLPQYNVRWGAQYLGALYRKFGKQLPFAIASYNGGPMLMENVLRGSAERRLALDELIDDIGPHESRNYVRMVVGHFLRYLAIYETPERAAKFRAELLPHAWKAEWLPHPDY